MNSEFRSQNEKPQFRIPHSAFRNSAELRLPQEMSQCAFEVRVAESIPRRYKPGGLYAGTGQEQFVGHLAKGKTRSKGGHRKQRGPPEHSPQSLGEVMISDWMWGYRVDRPLESIGEKGVVNGADDIIQCDPAH